MSVAKFKKDGNSEELQESGAGVPEQAEGAAEAGQLLAQKEEELKQVQDRMLRLAAEMENTRKRLEREKADAICFANESLIRALLPVVDNLHRAVEHSEQEASFQDLLEGVRMTLKGFLDTLARFGCEPFDSMGEHFDPNRHEAVLQQQSAEHPDMTVIQELQKGFMLRERLLRPAMVAVARQSKSEATEEK
jgi:molecular chaperone GrpE